jgi:OOP family OmpA-OmpF porin
MSKKGILTAGLLALILLCILCILFHAESIHRHLEPPAQGEEAKVQASIDEQIAGQTIEFDLGSPSISSRGMALLDRLVPILQSAPQTRIEIGGHTDNTGDPGYNLDLSRRRATAVREYLVSKGVEERRLTAVGYGQERPTADNGTPQGRLKNRRIEFKIYKGE